MKDFYYKKIEKLALENGYNVDYLWNKFNEMLSDGNIDMKYFEKVTNEKDW